MFISLHANASVGRAAVGCRGLLSEPRRLQPGGAAARDAEEGAALPTRQRRQSPDRDDPVGNGADAAHRRVRRRSPGWSRSRCAPRQDARAARYSRRRSACWSAPTCRPCSSRWASSSNPAEESCSPRPLPAADRRRAGREHRQVPRAARSTRRAEPGASGAPAAAPSVSGSRAATRMTPCQRQIDAPRHPRGRHCGVADRDRAGAVRRPAALVGRWTQRRAGAPPPRPRPSAASRTIRATLFYVGGGRQPAGRRRSRDGLRARGRSIRRGG